MKGDVLFISWGFGGDTNTFFAVSMMLEKPPEKPEK